MKPQSQFLVCTEEIHDTEEGVVPTENHEQEESQQVPEAQFIEHAQQEHEYASREYESCKQELEYDPALMVEEHFTQPTASQCSVGEEVLSSQMPNVQYKPIIMNFMPLRPELLRTLDDQYDEVRCYSQASDTTQKSEAFLFAIASRINTEGALLFIHVLMFCRSSKDSSYELCSLLCKNTVRAYVQRQYVIKGSIQGYS